MIDLQQLQDRKKIKKLRKELDLAFLTIIELKKINKELGKKKTIRRRKRK